MRVYRSGHGARVLLMLAMTVLAVAAITYGLGALEGWGRALAVGLAAGLLLTSSWVLVWVLRQNEERLRARALNDSLTDLPNRSSFVERVDRALASGGSRSIAVLLVDLDDFEEINHTLGREAGDRLLTAVGERLGESARPGGFAARLCGDEFAVFLGDVSDKSSAASAAERIGEALKAPIEVNGSEVLVSASVGVAVPEQEDGPEDLLRKADVAMHAAKRKGKARHKVFDSGADTTTSGRSLAEAEMRRAIEEEQFRVHYQPLVALGTGKVRGLEALVRWQHPVYGLMAPEEFVPLAEQTGLIVPIGRWVLREACRQMRLWQEEHPSDPPLMLSVNVSARQFQQPNLAEEISRTLESSGLGPHELILEITEGVMMHDASAASALRELQGSGIRFAMDDFGTGYFNLSYVKRLPVNILKIDRSYVSGLGSDAEDTAIVHATAAFAKALGLGLIAEGIESAEQLARLREVGCE
ncbi:MAG: EAL domain-containing protein, partial [Actinobacteria bacterium]|nr:EAL domain-containing protein [Actinomycetota bacterium]